MAFIILNHIPQILLILKLFNYEQIIKILIIVFLYELVNSYIIDIFLRLVINPNCFSIKETIDAIHLEDFRVFNLHFILTFPI